MFTKSALLYLVLLGILVGEQNGGASAQSTTESGLKTSVVSVVYETRTSSSSGSQSGFSVCIVYS